MDEKEIGLLKSIDTIKITMESAKMGFKTALMYSMGKLLLLPVITLIYGIPFQYLWNKIMIDFGLPHLSWLHASGLLLIFSWIFPTSHIPIVQQIDSSKNPKWLDEMINEEKRKRVGW